MSTKSENRTYDHMERQILALLADQDENRLRAFLVKQHPADIADVINRLSDAHREVVFDLLTTEKKVEVLDEMSITATQRILNHLPPASAIMARSADYLSLEITNKAQREALCKTEP